MCFWRPWERAKALAISSAAEWLESDQCNSRQVGTGLQTDSAPENNGKIAGRLEECLKNLPNADRELIVDYYRGKPLEKAGNRAALATRLGLTANALSIRACRVRQKLETCIHASQKKHEV